MSWRVMVRIMSANKVTWAQQFGTSSASDTTVARERYDFLLGVPKMFPFSRGMDTNYTVYITAVETYFGALFRIICNAAVWWCAAGGTAGWGG